MVTVFAKCSEDRDSIPDRVIPKTQKRVLDTLLFNTQQCKIRSKSKWSYLEKGVAPSPTP